MKYSRHQQDALVKHVAAYFEKYPAGSLEVTRAASLRNAEQQGLLHVLLREIAQEVGVSAEIFKQEIIKRDSEGVFPFWPQEKGQGLNGEIVFTPKSETRLTKKDESEMIERLHALAVEWGIELEAA